MLKIRKPEFAPAKLICQYKNVEMNQQLPSEILLTMNKEGQAPQPKQAPPSKAKNPRY